MIGKNSSSTPTRQISGVDSGNHNHSNRGRGRGGRGGRNARGGRGHGGRNNNNQSSNQSTTSTNDRSITRGYCREEWQNLSQQEKNRIYQARERLETARTIASMLREEYSQHQADDVSTITGTVPQRISAQVSSGNDNNTVNANSIAGVTRSIDQVNLDSAGQAFNRRRLNALYSSQRSFSTRRDCIDTAVF